MEEGEKPPANNVPKKGANTTEVSGDVIAYEAKDKFDAWKKSFEAQQEVTKKAYEKAFVTGTRSTPNKGEYRPMSEAAPLEWQAPPDKPGYSWQPLKLKLTLYHSSGLSKTEEQWITAEELNNLRQSLGQAAILVDVELKSKPIDVPPALDEAADKIETRVDMSKVMKSYIIPRLAGDSPKMLGTQTNIKLPVLDTKNVSSQTDLKSLRVVLVGKITGPVKVGKARMTIEKDRGLGFIGQNAATVTGSRDAWVLSHEVAHVLLRMGHELRDGQVPPPPGFWNTDVETKYKDEAIYGATQQIINPVRTERPCYTLRQAELIRRTVIDLNNEWSDAKKK